MLMNLCLRTAGKRLCEDNTEQILGVYSGISRCCCCCRALLGGRLYCTIETLVGLLEHDNTQVRVAQAPKAAYQY